MPTKTRMNVYFNPDLLNKVEALALRRNVSKSAIVEAAVASFLSADASERLEAVLARRMDRISRQIDGMDEDLAIVGETLSLFIRFWLTVKRLSPADGERIVRLVAHHVGAEVHAGAPRVARIEQTSERAWAADWLVAILIRLIYRLALGAGADHSQMGVKAIVKHLNARGIFTRDGGRWGIGQVHRILTRRTYIGEHEFNRRSKTKEKKPDAEVVTVEVPPLIEQATFDAVQALMKARNQKTALPHRVVIGPTLLTGICFCGNCGGAMTIRTGKGGRYPYYACSIKARQGETGCKGRAIPMDKLDQLVASHIEDRLLDPERLEELLEIILGRREEQSERRRVHIAELNRRAAESGLRL